MIPLLFLLAVQIAVVIAVLMAETEVIQGTEDKVRDTFSNPKHKIKRLSKLSGSD
jgi:hypothetical protein